MFIIVIFLISYIAMLLWNALIPEIFHGPELTYWQTMGLLVLARLFVGGHGARGKWKRAWKGHRHHHHHHGAPWGQRSWERSWDRGWSAPWSRRWRDEEESGEARDFGETPSEQWRGSRRGDWGPWSDMTAEDWYKFKKMSPQERRHMKEAWKAEFKARWQRPMQEPPQSPPPTPNDPPRS